MPRAGTEHVVGMVLPTDRPEGRETELDGRLPPAVKVVTRTLNFARGDEHEFRDSMPRYEEKVAELAALNASLILPAGAPPFMIRGFRAEREIIRRWEDKYGVPMFTSGQNHVRALRALGVRRFVGLSYFPAKLNAAFARYFNEAGFDVLAMEGIAVAFADAPRLSQETITAHVTGLVERHRASEAVYMLGSAWRTLGFIETLESSLGIPLVHPGPARHWEILVRLGFRERVQGYGRLLAEMPAAP